MRILFDQGVPVPLRQYLSGHTVDTVFERGWSILQNGELLDQAEQEGYRLLVTTDQNIQFQQNLTGQQLAFLVLQSTSWPRIRQHVDEIQAAIAGISPGDYVEIAA
jgi:predicted nuclease of predicted toxin-antitoxin system